MKPSNSLQIHPTEKASLSKAQKEFNRLTDRISSLRNRLLQTEKELGSLMQEYNARIPALMSQHSEMLGKMAFALEDGAGATKLGKHQLESLGDVIRGLLDQVGMIRELTVGEEALFNRWSPMSYQEMIDEEEKTDREAFAQYVKAIFGVEVDPDKLGDPEERERIEREIGQRNAEANERAHQWNGTGRRTKAQEKADQRRAEKAKAAEEMKNRSLRSVYISLAKLLHPDTEQDDQLRKAKEEEMKRLGAAYESGDLSTMLQMELSWVHQQSNNLSKLSDEKLDLFNSVLRDQVKEMEFELWEMPSQPRFSPLSRFMQGSSGTKSALKSIKAEANRLEVSDRYYRGMIRQIQSEAPKTVKALMMEFVRDWTEAMEMRELGIPGW
ncbi:MAG: J domain-containing protein [Bacteroidia bacterium]